MKFCRPPANAIPPMLSHLLSSVVIGLSAILSLTVFAEPLGSSAARAVVDKAAAKDIRNVVLVGKVVTMNRNRDILEQGHVWVDEGVIVAVARDRNALEAAVRELASPTANTATMLDRLNLAPVINLDGAIYPGLIDLHNHPEYAVYPLLPIKRKYKDRYEWRFYDEAYARRITNLNTLLTSPQYFNLATEVGRYGEVKALVGGTTSLQGSRSTLPSAKDECLVRNIETGAVTDRRAFSRVDIGRDAPEWQRMLDERNKGPLVVHLAEGTGPRMAAEFDAIKRSDLLGPSLVAIHGVALTASQFSEMATAKAKLVWSPLSNLMLYGQTADVAVAHRAGVLISLAPDWAPSGSKSILGELKVADLVNRHQLQQHFSDRDLVEMVTSNPAQAIEWGDRLGRIEAGYLADLLVIDNRAADPYRNLIEAMEANVKLVMVRGDALYGDGILMNAMREASQLESLAPMRWNGTLRRKKIAPNCPGTSLPQMSIEEVSTRIQRALDLRPDAFARTVSVAQFTKDLAMCGSEPHEPPSPIDAKRLLACRFQLPFEKTTLSPLFTASDPQYFSRLLANHNLPGYLKTLPSYYGPIQGAKRSTTQSPPLAP